MPTEKDGVSAALGMIFIILGVSVVVPGVILNLESPQTSAFSQDTNQRTVITGDVSSTVTAISNQDEVNVTLFDRKSGEANSTGPLMPGNSADVRLEGEDINVTVIDVFSTDEAAIKYVYPLYIGWPDGADQIVRQTPLIILLSTIVMLVGLMFTVQGVFH